MTKEELKALLSMFIYHAEDGEWFHDHTEMLESIGMTQEQYEEIEGK